MKASFIDNVKKNIEEFRDGNGWRIATKADKGDYFEITEWWLNERTLNQYCEMIGSRLRPDSYISESDLVLMRELAQKSLVSALEKYASCMYHWEWNRFIKKVKEYEIKKQEYINLEKEKKLKAEEKEKKRIETLRKKEEERRMQEEERKHRVKSGAQSWYDICENKPEENDRLLKEELKRLMRRHGN